MRIVIGLFLALVCSPVFADDCVAFLRPIGNIRVHQSIDPRITAIVEEVRSIASITAPYIICEWTGDMPPTPLTYINIGSRRKPISAEVVVVVSSALMGKADDVQCRGIFAHEFAHTVVGLEEWKRHVQLRGRLQYEMEMRTDLKAAQWVGAETVIRGIEFALAAIIAYDMELYAEAFEIDPSFLAEYQRKEVEQRAMRFGALEALRAKEGTH